MNLDKAQAILIISLHKNNHSITTNVSNKKGCSIENWGHSGTKTMVSWEYARHKK